MTSLEELLNLPLLEIGATRITTSTLVGMGLVLSLVWAVSTLVERSLSALARAKDGRWPASTLYTLSRLIRYLLWIAGLMMGLKVVGVDLTGVAVIGGAVGVGVGLGLQTLFANFASGVVLLIEGTLKVGDYVDLQSGVTGRVAEIGMRYTRVNTNDNIDIIVPNTELMNGRFVSWTFQSGIRRMHIPFGVAYGTAKETVRTAGLVAAARQPGVVEDAGHRTDVWLVKLGDSAMEFELVVWCSPELTARPAATHAELLWLLHDELLAHRIAIPFPTRDVNLRLVGEGPPRP